MTPIKTHSFFPDAERTARTPRSEAHTGVFRAFLRVLAKLARRGGDALPAEAAQEKS